jgi:cytochrome c-type biogenesis protein
MEAISLITAFVAGIISFLSPCILPLLPGYLSFLAGTHDVAADNYRLRALQGALVFGLGFSLVFVLMGATATAIGRLFVQYQHIFSIIMGVVVIALGLHMIGAFQLKILYREKKIHIKPKRDAKRLLQAFLIGLAFAFGWTPCVGPVLGGILTMATQQSSVYAGMLLLFVYAMGLWLPFLLAALFSLPVLGWLGKYPKLALRAQQTAGILLILMGVLLCTGYMTRLSYWLA